MQQLTTAYKVLYKLKYYEIFMDVLVLCYITQDIIIQ